MYEGSSRHKQNEEVQQQMMSLESKNLLDYLIFFKYFS